MGFTVDDLLSTARRTVFHPLVSLIVPGGLFLAVSLIDIGQDPSQVGNGYRSTVWREGLLVFTMLSWLYQLTRALNRIALNPNPKIRCDWPKEVVVVTGGSGGVGAELVQKMERLDATIVIMDVMPPPFRVGPRTHYFKTDVTSFGDVASVYSNVAANIGVPTILIANAGVVSGRTILNASQHDLRTTFDVNVLGVLFCIKAVLPDMIAANCGHIFVTSSAAAFTPVASVVDYSASKAAVTCVVEGLQTELKMKHGNPSVKISAIFPTTIATKMFEGIDKSTHGFMMPILLPGQVADRILQILSAGQSDMVIMPPLAHIIPWIRVLPSWMRIAFQNFTAHTMDHLAVAKATRYEDKSTEHSHLVD